MATTEKITSRDNKRLKDAKRVRNGKFGGLMFVEGVRLCEEAVRSGVQLRDCFVTRGFLETGRGSSLVNEAELRGASVFELSESLLDSIADTKNSQGVVLICDRPDRAELRNFLNTGKLAIVIALSEVNNPANLGAIMRVAEAAGVSGVVTTSGSADVYSPKSLRASMGSAFRLPIRENTELEEIIRWAHERQLQVTAAAGEGSVSYTNTDWTKPRLLIFGSEGHGLSPHDLELVDETIYIPMDGNVESLNLAVACGITLFEARRQFDL
jgi:TrmH family RNA methyltransferase